MSPGPHNSALALRGGKPHWLSPFPNARNFLSVLPYSLGMMRFSASRFLSAGSILFLALLALPIPQARAQSSRGVAPTTELYRTIAALDTALFASARVDRCDLETFESFFVKDVEFYHDQGGLTVGSEKVTQQIEQNICGKVHRELVAGTLEVYPMKDYGAVEIGVHRFYQPKQGNEATGEAKFIHLWQQQDGAWKITRVISYDHVGLQK